MTIYYIMFRFWALYYIMFSCHENLWTFFVPFMENSFIFFKFYYISRLLYERKNYLYANDKYKQIFVYCNIIEIRVNNIIHTYGSGLLVLKLLKICTHINTLKITKILTNFLKNNISFLMHLYSIFKFIILLLMLNNQTSSTPHTY